MITHLGNNNAAARLKTINNKFFFFLSCGQPEMCHTWTERGGVELITVSLVSGGIDYSVVLLAQTNLIPNDDDSSNTAGTLDTLTATSFRLGTCDE